MDGTSLGSLAGLGAPVPVGSAGPLPQRDRVRAVVCDGTKCSECGIVHTNRPRTETEGAGALWPPSSTQSSSQGQRGPGAHVSPLDCPQKCVPSLAAAEPQSKAVLPALRTQACPLPSDQEHCLPENCPHAGLLVTTPAWGSLRRLQGLGAVNAP